jgi:hypothetical protein
VQAPLTPQALDKLDRGCNKLCVAGEGTVVEVPDLEDPWGRVAYPSD